MSALRLTSSQLASLDSPHPQESVDIRQIASSSSIDVSNNNLSSIPQCSLFSSCTQIDVSCNHLLRLSCLLPLSRRLKSLNAADNRLCSLSNLPSFILLQELILACNDIRELPPLKAPLTFIDLSSNLLTTFPPFLALEHLQILNLSHNQISSLDDVTSLPPSLQSLNLSSNNISLLSSLFHLPHLHRLSSFSFSSNPALSTVTFNYRPFVFALLYDTMIEVDGCCLSEEEILIGEKILQTKLSKLKREAEGREGKLREALVALSPSTRESEASLNKNLRKVLEKRREYRNSADYGSAERSLPLSSPYSNRLPSSPSTHSSPRLESKSISSSQSPYSQWTKQVTNKENRLPSESDTTSSRTIVDEEKTAREEKASTGDSPLPFPFVRPPPDYRTPPSPSTSYSNPLPLPYSIPPSSNSPLPPNPLPRSSFIDIQMKAAWTIQRWWRGKRRIERNEEEKRQMNEKRILALERKVELLTETARRQAECSEMLHETVRWMNEKVFSLETLLFSTIPSARLHRERLE